MNSATSQEPSYEELAYPSVPLSQTQPDRMLAIAHMLGCRTAQPQAARVLELGCSDGANLAWLAAYAPASTFVGVDLSHTAIARGRALTSDLDNLSLEVGDVAELDRGEFDIVIAHGVYSWLPTPNILLSCIDRHLADHGIAYVSYNTRPGFHVRELAGEVMRHFRAGRPTHLRAARALQDWVRSTAIDTTHAGMMRQAMELVAAKPDHVVAHDEFATNHHAPFFDEFVTAAAGHGLAYLSESHLGDSEVSGLTVPTDLIATAGSVMGDEVARQQLLDYARNRAFRQTLLVRPGNSPRSYQPDPARLADLWLAAPANELTPDAAGRRRFRVLSGVELTTDSPELARDLDALGQAWPECLPGADLHADPRALLAVYLGRGLELRSSQVAARRPRTRPATVAHVRRRANGGTVTSARHNVLTLDDPLARAAVELLDGTRSRAQVTRTLAANLASGQVIGGHHLTGDLRAALDQLITELGAASLLVG